MKNLVKQLLVAVLILSLLFSVACSSPGGKDSDANKQGGDTSKQGSTGKEVSRDDDSFDDDQGGYRYKVKEQVLVDQDDVVITLKSLQEGFFGPEFLITTKNNRDREIAVGVSEITINGVMMQAMFPCEVRPGKESTDELSFWDLHLERAGIDVIQTLELKFEVGDQETWDHIFFTDTIKITTDFDPSYVQTFDDSGLVAVEDDGVKIVVKTKVTTGMFDTSEILVYMENNTDGNIVVEVRDVTVNGLNIRPEFSCGIVTGKKAFEALTFFDFTLEENGVESIDEIELQFYFRDISDWDTIYDYPLVKITMD